MPEKREMRRKYDKVFREGAVARRTKRKPPQFRGNPMGYNWLVVAPLASDIASNRRFRR